VIIEERRDECGGHMAGKVTLTLVQLRVTELKRTRDRTGLEQETNQSYGDSGRI